MIPKSGYRFSEKIMRYLETDRMAHIGGRPACGAQVAQGRGLCALGELVAVAVEQEPVMAIDGRGQAQQFLQ